MIYVIWGLLNLALVGLFLVLCYKAVVLIRERYGVILAFILALGLTATLINANGLQGNEANASEREKWKLDDEKNYPGLSKRSLNTLIANNPMFKTMLIVEFMVTESGSFLPLAGFTIESGIHSGVEWKCNYVTLSQEGDELHYIVNGTISWKLFPLGLYSQGKVYEGKIVMSQPIR